MMKRVLSLFMAMVACVGFCFGLAGCNKCVHANKTLLEDTATCEEAGIVTYQCDDCGKTITEESKALNHDYSIYVGDSATCTASGYITYQCSRCNSTKDTFSPKIEHQYSGAKCRLCGGINPDYTEKRVKYSTSGKFEVSDAFGTLDGRSTVKISLTFDKDSTSVKLFVYVSLSSAYLIYCDATIYDADGNLIVNWKKGYALKFTAESEMLTAKRALVENEYCYVQINAIKI